MVSEYDEEDKNNTDDFLDFAKEKVFLLHIYPHDEQDYSNSFLPRSLAHPIATVQLLVVDTRPAMPRRRGFFSHCLDVEDVECILDMEGLVPAEPSKQHL